MNVRALKLKANSTEFESKLADIKRLIGCLEKFVNNVVFDSKVIGWDSVMRGKIIDGELFLSVTYNHANERKRLVEFHLYRGGVCLEREMQLDLRTVRQIHGNLDLVIELAESVCGGAGRLTEFQTKMARFE